MVYLMTESPIGYGALSHKIDYVTYFLGDPELAWPFFTNVPPCKLVTCHIMRPSILRSTKKN